MNWLNAYGDNTRLNAYNARYLTQAEDAKAQVAPTTFQGFGDALTKAVPAAFYESVSSWNDFISFKLRQGIETEDAFDPNDYSDAQERAAQQVEYEARMARKKVKSNTPNPETTGTASQVIHGIARTLPKAAGYTVMSGGSAIVAAPLFGADLGIYKAGELRDKGVDAKTAAMAGWAEGIGSAIGLAAPASLGTSYGKSVLFGVTTNPALDVSQQSAEEYILRNYGYADVAAEYDPFNTANILTSAVLGGAFGVMGARSARGSKIEDAKAAIKEIDEKAGISDKSKAAVEAVGNKTKQAVGAVRESDFGRTVDAITEPAQEKVVKVTRDAVDAAMEIKSAVIHQRDQLVGEKGSVTRSLEQEKTAREQFDDGEVVSVSDTEIDYQILYDEADKIHAALNVEFDKTIGKYSLDPTTGELKPDVEINWSVRPRRIKKEGGEAKAVIHVNVTPPMADVPKVKNGKKLTRKQREAEKMRQRQEEAGNARQKDAVTQESAGPDESVKLSVKEFNEEVTKAREELGEPLTTEEMAAIQAELDEEVSLYDKQQKRIENLRKYAPELPETKTPELEVTPEQVRAEVDTPETARAEVTPEEVRADEVVAAKETPDETRVEEAKAEAKPEEVATTREAEVETSEPAPAPQEGTSTVNQIISGIIDNSPLPDDAKAVVKEVVGEQLNMFDDAEVARKTIEEPAVEPPVDHPRKGVFTPEQALDNKVNKVIEEQPDMFIVDESGNQVAAADYLEDAQVQAKADTEFAQAIGEGGSCMWQQGALDF